MPPKHDPGYGMAIAAVVIGALVWGLIWYPYRMLKDAGISGPMATQITYLLAMLFGAFMLPRVWRELKQSGKHAGGWLLLLVLSTGWTNLGYVLAVLNGEVMRVLLLFYLAPLWTILFSYWLLGERLNRYGYMIILLSLGGAVTMLWKPQFGPPLPEHPAEWIGLSAGMGFALSNVVSRRAAFLIEEAKSWSVWIGTALVTVPVVWMQGGVSAQLASLNAWSMTILALLGLVICTTSYAVQYGVSRLPANRSIILFLSELVFAAVSSNLLAGEKMALRDWLGAFLIVSASLLSGKLYTKKQDRDPGIA